MLLVTPNAAPVLQFHQRSAKAVFEKQACISTQAIADYDDDGDTMHECDHMHV